MNALPDRQSLYRALGYLNYGVIVLFLIYFHCTQHVPANQIWIMAFAMVPFVLNARLATAWQVLTYAVVFSALTLAPFPPHRLRTTEVWIFCAILTIYAGYWQWSRFPEKSYLHLALRVMLSGFLTVTAIYGVSGFYAPGLKVALAADLRYIDAAASLKTMALLAVSAILVVLVAQEYIITSARAAAHLPVPRNPLLYVWYVATAHGTPILFFYKSIISHTIRALKRLVIDWPSFREMA